jgi:hypothetical protein
MTFFVPKDIEAILEELKDENDRAVALVGASLIEHALQEAIRSVLRPFSDNADLNERVFGNRGLFPGLSSKITGAFVLKIIGKQTQRDLELINKIRNTFAHDMNPLDFSYPEIKSRCSELHIPKNSLASGDPRKEYHVAVQIYSATLTLWSIRELVPEAEQLEILNWLSA